MENDLTLIIIRGKGIDHSGKRREARVLPAEVWF
jgi:hypothetical protein